MTALKAALAFAGLGAVAVLGYQRLRGPVLTWGATSAEATSRLPGDELLPDADGVSTRAIDIQAPASAVWPWLGQMGPSPRGGAYTYDWIENLLGLDMHSVDRVLPEFQDPQVGDTVAFGPNRMRLERVETGRYGSLRFPLHEVGALLDAGAVHPRRSARNHLIWLADANSLPRARVDEVLRRITSRGRSRSQISQTRQPAC